ncbi:NPC intracellular cholesterol transporter 2 isoform X2 [Bemisia tabaci]
MTRTRTMLIFSVLVMFVFQGCGSAKINHGNCPSSRYPKQKCTVHEVSVDVCRGGTQADPCKVRRGGKFTVNFSYTPGFRGDKMRSLPYWDGPGLSFPGLNPEACSHTQCPVLPNIKQNFTQTLSLASYFPPGRFPVAWRLWNEKNEQCCFFVHIKLI